MGEHESAFSTEKSGFAGTTAAGLRAGIPAIVYSFTAEQPFWAGRITAGLARVQASGGNLAAEMKSKGIWESRQAPFKRALQRHPDPRRWERFVAEASQVDRMAKGRAEGDPWLALERLLVALAEARAVRLLVRGVR